MLKSSSKHSGESMYCSQSMASMLWRIVLRMQCSLNRSRQMPAALSIL